MDYYMDNFTIKFLASNVFISSLSGCQDKLSMSETMIVVDRLVKRSDLIEHIDDMRFNSTIDGWEFTLVVNGSKYYRNLLVTGCEDIKLNVEMNGMSYELNLSSGHVLHINDKNGIC